MRYPEQILSRHVRRRIADATQNETSTPMDAHGAHISASERSDSDSQQTLDAEKRLSRLFGPETAHGRRTQRENLRNATIGSSKHYLYGKIVAETTEKISQAAMVKDSDWRWRSKKQRMRFSKLKRGVYKHITTVSLSGLIYCCECGPEDYTLTVSQLTATLQSCTRTSKKCGCTKQYVFNELNSDAVRSFRRRASASVI